MLGTEFEADELYQNAGKKAYPTATSTTRRTDEPINAQASERLRTTDRQSSVSFLVTAKRVAPGLETEPIKTSVAT